MRTLISSFRAEYQQRPQLWWAASLAISAAIGTELPTLIALARQVLS